MTSPRTLLSEWKISPKKQFGQNFLADPSTAEMIISRSKILPENIILELGAGLGALTIPLAAAANKVYAVEKDLSLVPVLQNEILSRSIDNVEILNENMLKLDIKKLAAKHDQRIVVIGNLPYNISSQILIKLIKERGFVSRAILMFQKELARRICGNPGSKDYGRISVMLKYCADTVKIAEVKASLFFPKPKIDSEILEIKFKDRPDFMVDDEMFLFSVIKAAFGKRRKTLKNSLSGSELGISAQTAETALNSAGIDPSRRAETLTIEEFSKLGNAIYRGVIR
ncbi:MAG: ribosomal RNA small subunit methyltransferase A [Desulfobacterium sp.]|nr:ribosomal RNA small subunit methyltransferase A [Desulfobacterium sp.]MBU3948672.1 ribosomal RNA small subunit methyltransferase A [Pseudomonadota bacterium]MBU4010590.1 ribosomal RNA small subunit methyltransferase A [Pseudomonadota bacterium]MBU4036283.1 ribosomal RNA small subunit methyltransferase A [Pseudomonadota bacterium]